MVTEGCALGFSGGGAGIPVPRGKKCGAGGRAEQRLESSLGQAVLTALG